MTAALLLGATAEMGAPALAESRMRDKLSAMGEVQHLEVSSNPSAKLLLGKPDEVDVELGKAEMGGESEMDGGMMKKALDVDQLRARIDEVAAGPITLDGIAVDKQGDKLTLEAAMVADQIEAIMPGATLSASDDGALQVQMDSLPMAMPMPMEGPIIVEIRAENGAIVAEPQGDLPMPIPPQTLFAQEDLQVEKLHAATDEDELVLDAEVAVKA